MEFNINPALFKKGKILFGNQEIDNKSILLKHFISAFKKNKDLIDVDSKDLISKIMEKKKTSKVKLEETKSATGKKEMVIF